MAGTREFLRSIGLPSGDLGGLPDSAKRFPDGAYPAGSRHQAVVLFTKTTEPISPDVDYALGALVDDAFCAD